MTNPTYVPTDAEIIQVCSDRLKGNGAWNGQGLLVFLASTSRKDPERVWMEPLRDLCAAVVYAAEDGDPMPELTEDDLAKINDLIAYSQVFHAALAATESDPNTPTEPPAQQTQTSPDSTAGSTAPSGEVTVTPVSGQ